MAQALEYCLDNDISLQERAERLEAEGWSRTADTNIADVALSHALLLSRVKATEPDTWATEQAKSAKIAASLRKSKGYEEANTLFSDDHVVTIEPNRSGLSTCLYVGPASDLQVAKNMLPDSALRMTGPMSLIRGETSDGVLIAYSLPAEISDHFPDPLTYLSTFTVVLDRTEGTSQ